MNEPQGEAKQKERRKRGFRGRGNTLRLLREAGASGRSAGGFSGHVSRSAVELWDVLTGGSRYISSPSLFLSLLSEANAKRGKGGYKKPFDFDFDLRLIFLFPPISNCNVGYK